LEALMNSTHPGRKEKIKHEFREMLELFLYLAFFFGSTRESEGTRDLSGNGFWGLKRSR
jgi:hypothetical protein